MSLYLQVSWRSYLSLEWFAAQCVPIVASKHLVSVVLHGFSRFRELRCREDKSRFLRSRGCTDQTSVLLLLRPRHLCQKPIMEAALDSVGG